MKESKVIDELIESIADTMIERKFPQFRSGNEIKVERAVVTRRELREFFISSLETGVHTNGE